HVFGGRPHDPTPVAAHEVYDPATNQWTEKSPMPLARDHMGVAVIDGKIHIVGGRTGGQTDNVGEHDVYDPASDKWTKAAPMPTPRSGGAAVYYHGLLIYAGGECKKRDPNAGFGGGEDFDETEGYDPKTDTWRTLAKLPSARQAFGAAADGTAAYFPGGTLRCGALALTDQTLVFRLK
ncbi:MAG: kelch repeat-containing protein, partial [Xanthobacteraceae bacterium]